MRALGELVWRWGPVAAYVCLVYSLSLDPATPKPGTPGVDKVLHLVEYAILGLLLARALGGTVRGLGVVALVLVGACVGVGDELVQSHVPGRQAGVPDVVADVAGVSAGVLVAARVWTRSPVDRWV